MIMESEIVSEKESEELLDSKTKDDENKQETLKVQENEVGIKYQPEKIEKPIFSMVCGLACNALGDIEYPDKKKCFLLCRVHQFY